MTSTLQARWQIDIAKTNANQAADRIALRFPYAAYQSVAAFFDDDMKPVVGTGAAAIGYLFKVSISIFKFHPFQHFLDIAFRSIATDTYGVFAFDARAWVHKFVGKITIVADE